MTDWQIDLSHLLEPVARAICRAHIMDERQTDRFSRYHTGRTVDQWVDDKWLHWRPEANAALDVLQSNIDNQMREAYEDGIGDGWDERAESEAIIAAKGIRPDHTARVMRKGDL